MAATELLSLPLRGWAGIVPALRATHQVPAGWSAREQNGVLVLTPTDLPAGATVALVLPDAETVGANHDAWFAAQWKAVTAGFSVETQGVVGRRRTGAGLLALHQTARMKNPEGASLSLFFFSVRAGNHVQHGALITDTKELMDLHQTAAKAFMESLTLAP